MRRDLDAGVDAAVQTHTGPGWLREGCDAAGLRQKIRIRIFGVDAAFDGMAFDVDVFLPVAEHAPGGDAQLLLEDVDAGDSLGDGVLDLKARVHLHKIEVAGPVEQEFHGPRVGIAGRQGGPHRGRPISTRNSAVTARRGPLR